STKILKVTLVIEPVDSSSVVNPFMYDVFSASADNLDSNIKRPYVYNLNGIVLVPDMDNNSIDIITEKVYANDVDNYTVVSDSDYDDGSKWISTMDYLGDEGNQPLSEIVLQKQMGGLLNGRYILLLNAHPDLNVHLFNEIKFQLDNEQRSFFPLQVKKVY